MMSAPLKITALLAALLLATATMAQDKATADPTYAQAMQSYADADLESAANSTATLMAKYPKSATVMLLSGNIAVARHQYDAAITAFDKGLRRVPKSDKELASKLYIGKAKALMGLDKYADAKATLDEAQLKAGGTIELHMLRAMANEHLGYKWQAADDYVAAGASLPLYNFYVRTGDQAKVDKLMEDYVKGIGREHKISPQMTALRLSSGETYEAVNDMLHALEAGNYDEEPLLKLDRAASAYLSLSLKTYVKRTSDNGTVAHAYGRLLMSKGAYADALDVYKMASANGQSLSDDCAVDALACLLHLHQFDAVDSLRHMVSPAAQSALLADADHLEAMLRSADNATAAQCVAMADKNMQNGHWSPQVLAIRAQANELMGKHSDAASDAQKCLALYAKRDAPEYPILNPPHADVPSVRHLSPSASNLSAALIALAILRTDDSQAAELYTQAVNSEVYRPELLYAAACLRSRQGHQAEAVALIDKSLQAGFYDVEWLNRTPLLADARTEAAFGKLLSAYADKATSPIDLSALNFQPGQSAKQTAAQKLPQYAPADMTEAFRLYNDGQNREAFQMFQALVTEDPANGTAYLYRGLIYADEGLKADAISSLSTALRLLPKADKANRAKAVCRMSPLMTSAMPFDENVRKIALDAVDQEIKNQGRTPELLWARLCCLSEYHRDLADLNTVLQANISPSVNKEVHKSIGLSLSAKGDLNGAISAYTAALAIAPTDERLLGLRSSAYLHTADTLSAIRDLCRNLIANPQARDRNILRMYYPYIQKALDDLATESATDPANHDVANAKVALALRYGRTAEAYRFSKKLTGVTPSLQAQALIGMGLYRQAKSLLLASDSLTATPEELRVLAEACMHMGELAAAHMYLKQAAALNPANPLIYAAQAEVSLLSDNLDAAAAYADTACALNPTAALMETLRICVQKGDYRSAGVLASECSNKWWYKADDNWWAHERMQKRKFIEQMRSDDSQDAEPGPYDDDEEEVPDDVIAEDDEEDYEDWEYSASTKTPQWALSLTHRLWAWAGPTVAPQPSCSIGYYAYSAAIEGDDEGVKCGVDMARKEGTGYDWYYIALAYATTGADDLAADALSTAFSRGFCHFHLIEDAPEFEPLAESDKFANVVSRLKNEHVKSIASLLND